MYDKVLVRSKMKVKLEHQNFRSEKFFVLHFNLKSMDSKKSAKYPLYLHSQFKIIFSDNNCLPPD